MPIGYVYMISSSTGNYVGSTTRKIDERFMGHIYDLKYDDVGVTSKIVLNGNNVFVKTLEEVEYIDDEDTLLRQEEQKWIDMTDCVNKCRAYTPDDWYEEQAKETAKEWRKNNKSIVNQNKKMYRERHKEQIKEKMRDRYEATKEHRLEYSKQRYSDIAEEKREYSRQRYNKIKDCNKEKMECPICNKILAKHSFRLHNKRFHSQND